MSSFPSSSSTINYDEPLEVVFCDGTVRKAINKVKTGSGYSAVVFWKNSHGAIFYEEFSLVDGRAYDTGIGNLRFPGSLIRNRPSSTLVSSPSWPYYSYVPSYLQAGDEKLSSPITVEKELAEELVKLIKCRGIEESRLAERFETEAKKLGEKIQQERWNKDEA